MTATRAIVTCPCLAAVLFLSTGAAWGYLVGPAASLEKMTGEADLVFKGTAGAGETVEDDAFKPLHGFAVRETRFKVISVIKGEAPGDVAFRHYDAASERFRAVYMPQSYHFEAGRSYIVFAKKGGAAGTFRQLWMSHTAKQDQGVLLCADDKPVAAKTVKEVVRAELMAMLRSAAAGDAGYAVGQLDDMSGGNSLFGNTQDFDRKDVLGAVRGLMAHGDPKVAGAAIRLVGSHNPYMSDERTVFWLAAAGAEFPGIGKMDPKMRNPGGELYWKDLVALADGDGPAGTRALAVLALGLVREPALRRNIDRWLADPEAEVRAAAALLLADFPGPETVKQLTALAGDATPAVRECAARAAGFGRFTEMADTLAKLLEDKEARVRAAAAMSLLSFSPKDEGVARVFRANVANEEFRPLFLIALARANPEAHLDALAQVVVEKPEPENFWGGKIPAFDAWEILFRYLQGRPADEARSGKLDRYLDAMEKVGGYSSSEPRDIYAFYLQRGMTERAKKFREAAKKAVTYDLDYYFNMVDENPSLYKRE